MAGFADKKKKLIQYAEKAPLDDFPGFHYIVTLDSKYMRVSSNSLKLIGYKSNDQLYETTYANMPCRACENAEYFEIADKIVAEHKTQVEMLSYNNFDSWKILFGQKKLIYQDNEPIGILASFMDVTSARLIDLSRFIFKDKKIKKKQFHYIIQDDFNALNGLTDKEQECLFFLIRGLSYKEIAACLNIFITTVQSHMEHIKYKFNVHTRSQLIEKAIHEGFMSVIPKSLFN